MKYLVTWEVKQTCNNGKLDITNEQIICNSDEDVIDMINEVLFDMFPNNPNFKIYELTNKTDRFADTIAQLNNPEKLSRQWEDHKKWLRSLKQSA